MILNNHVKHGCLNRMFNQLNLRNLRFRHFSTFPPMKPSKLLRPALAGLAFTLSLSLSSCGISSVDGDKGDVGLTGPAGADGTSCVVRETAQVGAAFEVVCGDEVKGYLYDGADGAQGLQGATGSSGSQGLPGEKGDPGTPCTMAENAAKTGYTVTCGDEVAGDVLHGKDGAPGATGTKGDKGDDCSVETVAGGVNITCGTNDPVFLASVKGDAGTSCVVEATTAEEAAANNDAAYKVLCGTEVKGYLYNGTKGADGTGCTSRLLDKDNEADDEYFDEHPNGGTLVTCGEVSTVVENGAAGGAGENGKSCSKADDLENSAFINIVCGGDDKPQQIAKAYCGPTAYDPASAVCDHNRVFESPKTVWIGEEEVGVPIELVYVPSGQFNAQGDEGKPVTLTRGYYIGTYEVTQGQWKEVMKSNPSNESNPSNFSSCGVNCPVETVSWNNITTTGTGFLAKLNTATGETFRLPTEAEWEFAARGGPSGVGDNFTYAGTSDESKLVDYAVYNTSATAQVGSKKPNQLGLYDMSGNVFEWTSDAYDVENGDGGWDNVPYPNGTTDPKSDGSAGSRRVLRGGSWNDDAGYATVSYRYDLNPVAGTTISASASPCPPEFACVS
jgi:formylglycine-generating enzyme required for sulfatase activity